MDPQGWNIDWHNIIDHKDQEITLHTFTLSFLPLGVEFREEKLLVRLTN
jgi:hypothetical protein